MATKKTLIGNIKGPKGDPGDKGETGATGAPGTAATINVGTVTTSAYGTTAQVTNSGTETAAVFDFVIPQGKPGEETTRMSALTLDQVTASTETQPIPAVGEVGAVVWGKVIKFFNDIKTAIVNKINYSDCVANLTSTSSTLPLAANQGKALNDAITSMQTRTACAVVPANSSVITHASGYAYCFPLGNNRVVVYMDIVLKTTSARSAGMGAFYLTVNDKKVKILRPTGLPCTVNSDGVMRFTGVQEAGGVRYITHPVAWEANKNFYVSGVFAADLVD